MLIFPAEDTYQKAIVGKLMAEIFQSTQVRSAPVLWAYPFLLTFTAGVFADATETQHRKLFIAVVTTTLLAQAALCAIYLLAPGQ